MTSTASNLARPPMLPVNVSLFCRDEASSYGWLGNIMIVVGRAPPTAAAADNYYRGVQQLCAKHRDGIGIVTLVSPDATPHPDAREKLLCCFRDYWRQITAALFVVEGEGFGAAIQRSFMNAAMLVTPARDRIRIVANFESNASWFSRKLDIEAQSEQMQRAIGRFWQAEKSPLPTPR